MIEIKAPNQIPFVPKVTPTLFLAGSIEMGTAVHWQERVSRELARHDGIIFNPRRDDWDNSWEQSIHDARFYEQVSWELDHLYSCSHVAMYFDPETRSPITLMEYGLLMGRKPYSAYNPPIVCCPPGFWRKGNVDVVAQRHNQKVHDTIDDMIEELHAVLK